MTSRKALAIRVLGPYGGSAPGYRMTTFLIDGETALDAGALTEALPLAAQRRLRRVVLTHAHLDHVASLPFLVENLYGRERPLEIIAPAPVLRTLSRHVFNDAAWPDFTRLPSRRRPTIVFRPVAVGRPFAAGGVRFTPLPVDHIVAGLRLPGLQARPLRALLGRHDADAPALGARRAGARPEGDLSRGLVLGRPGGRGPGVLSPHAATASRGDREGAGPRAPCSCTT